MRLQQQPRKSRRIQQENETWFTVIYYEGRIYWRIEHNSVLVRERKKIWGKKVSFGTTTNCRYFKRTPTIDIELSTMSDQNSRTRTPRHDRSTPQAQGTTCSKSLVVESRETTDLGEERKQERTTPKIFYSCLQKNRGVKNS